MSEKSAVRIIVLAMLGLLILILLGKCFPDPCDNSPDRVYIGAGEFVCKSSQ